MKKIYEAAAVIFFLCLSVLGIFKFEDEVMPYRDMYGCLWNQYRLEENDSVDIMFFGSSLAYCNVIPSIIYDGTGYSAYVMAGPGLTVKQTYYYMKEAFKTQSPDLVFLETTGMFFSEYTDYSRINIGYMPRGVNRAAAALFAAEREELTGLLFPSYNYHELWTDFFDPEKKDEINREYTRDPLAGYTFLKETVAQDKRRDRSLTDYSAEVYAKNLETLKRIADMCRGYGVEIVLYSAPMYSPINGEYYKMLERDARTAAPYYNFDSRKEAIGLDMENDFYDIFHLNYRGAVKFTNHILDLITSYNIEKKQHDTNLWNERARDLKRRMGL